MKTNNMIYPKWKTFLFPLITISCGVNPGYFLNKLTAKQSVEDLLQIAKSNNIPEVKNFSNSYDIKILSLAPEDVSRKNITQNFFLISNYQDSKKNFNPILYNNYAYLLKNGNKIIWLSNYLGLLISGEQKDESFYPKKIYFMLKDGTYEGIDVEDDGGWTKYTYKNSVIFVNNQDAKNPFDMNRSKVDINEFSFLACNLKETTALQFIKYFFDFIASQNGMKVTYFDENYFNVKFNNLGNYYINSDENQAIVEGKLSKMKEVILDAQEDGKNLYCTKLYVDFPYGHLEAVKHVILLVRYIDSNNNDQWFIIDTNGNPDYLGQNFVKAVDKLGFKFSNNETFIQSGNNCDTCASIVEVLLSDYWKNNDHKIPLFKEDIDYKEILDSANKKSISSVFNNFFKTEYLKVD